MMKKVWLILLAVALVFGFVLASCGGDNGKKDEIDEDDFTKVVLGEYNTWGGQKDKQIGWATDGYEWEDDSVTPKVVSVAESKGYKLDDFQKAKYLVLKVGSAKPAGGFHLIWGGNGATEAESKELGGWNSRQVFADSGTAASAYGASKDGDTVKIELAKAFKDNKYADYIADTTTAVRLVMAYYSPDIESLEIEEAYLLISEEKPDVEEETPPPDTSDFPTFSNAKLLGAANMDAQWTFGSTSDKHGTLADLYGGKYFVIAVICPEGTNAGGFGGLQLAVQGDGAGTNSWAGSTTIKNTGDWTSFAHEEGDLVYFVIDLADFPHIQSLEADTKPVTQAQFYINYGADEQLGEKYVGYITTANLSALPSGAVGFTHANAELTGGYISKTVALTPAP
jgi:hypothetical protein